MTHPLPRRTVVKGLALTTVAAAFVGRASAAAEPVKLSPKDPAALALGYVEDASLVDVKKYPAYVKGSNCENCLQLQGKPGDAYRPCSLFAGKVVSVKGWCSGWAAEM
jgi:hypothetical protein